MQLARSEAYEQQAFRVRRAYGLQFHLEVDAALASEWAEVPAYAQSLRELLGDEGLPTCSSRSAATRPRRPPSPGGCSPPGWSTSSG